MIQKNLKLLFILDLIKVVYRCLEQNIYSWKVFHLHIVSHIRKCKILFLILTHFRDIALPNPN